MSSNRTMRDCPVCGPGCGPAPTLLGRLDSRFGAATYDLVHCQGCELIFLSPLPEQSVFERMYIQDGQFDEPAYRGPRAAAIHGFYKGRAVALLTATGGVRRPQRVLEIGAGLSWMSFAAKSLCAKLRTVAQDLSAEVAGECTWVDRYLVGELASCLPEIQQLGPFQVISMTHVIEHLPDPVATLNICRAVLDEKGIVFITAPYRPKGWDTGAAFSVWERWSYNHVPAHLQYFNAAQHEGLRSGPAWRLATFEASAEEGQAFECWLRHPPKN